MIPLVIKQIRPSHTPRLYLYRSFWSILFFLCLGISVQAQTYSGPIIITTGGTYTGNWESTDPNVPAVEIRTSAPVTIQNSRIRSKGHLIFGPNNIGHLNITVRNTYGYGVPPNVSGKSPGRFLAASYFDNIVVENCYMEGTAGIYLLTYQGNNTTSQTVKIRYNRARNIDGRISNGSGGYSGDNYVQFAQFDKVQNVSNMEIAWNEIVNEPNNSRPEDVINMYLSSGTSASPLLIHDNFIFGSYPRDPGVNGFSGGGIITDGGSNDASVVPHHIRIYNNVILSTSNYGLAIAAGHDNELYNNRVFSSAVLFDGTTIASQNVGMYIWNINTSTAFGNNFAYGNVVGWVKGAGRNDMWFPDASTEYSRNTGYSGTVDQNVEIGEFVGWRNRLSANNVFLGPDFVDANIVLNPGFEQGNNLWETQGNATAKNSNSQSGTWCMEIGPGAGGRRQILHLRPSTTYTLDGYGVVLNGAEVGLLGIDVFDSANNLLANHSISFTSTSYTQKSVTFTTPASVRWARVYMSKDAGVGSLFRVDNIRLLAPSGLPAAPSGLSATPTSSSQINLSWSDNSNNETGFKIERKTGSSGTYSEIHTTGANATTYSNTGLSPSTQYYYRVRASNASGQSPYSNEANTTTSSGNGSTTVVNDNVLGTGNNQFEFVSSASWAYGTELGMYQDDNHWSQTANAYYQVRFNGTQIKVYSKKKDNHGIMAVSIDGGSETMVDLYSTTLTQQALVYTSPVLAGGQHTLKVRVTGTKNASSLESWVIADKVEIISGDTTAPAAISNLSAPSSTADSVTLNWTAPGDDGSTGTAASYDIRYSTATITEANWASATQVTGEPAPAAAATAQSHTVTGLNAGTTYYFAMKTSDEVANTSPISNVPSKATVTLVTTSVNDNTMGSGNHQFEYVTSADWPFAAETGHYQNDNHYSGTANAYYQVRFRGTQVRIYSKKKDNHGIMAVSIDGGAETMVDLYSPTIVFQALVYTSPVLADGQHVLKVRVTGTKNASSLESWIIADRVDCISLSGTDVVPPSTVANLSAPGSTSSSVTLNWTAPGNDGSAGTASTYDVRYSTSPITDANWDSATQATGEPAPGAAGTSQSFAVNSLTANTTYYFALRTMDAAGNRSGISNIPSKATLANIVVINDNTLGTANNQYEYVQAASWAYGSETGMYQNDNHWSKTANAYYQVRFNGTQIKVYSKKKDNHGIMAVSIDGGPETMVDLYSTTLTQQALVYTSPTLTSGQHTLKVRVTGTKNASSFDSWVIADKVEITQ